MTVILVYLINSIFLAPKFMKKYLTKHLNKLLHLYTMLCMHLCLLDVMDHISPKS